MANPSYMFSLLGGLDRDMRRAFRAVFDYAFATLKFGPPDHEEPSVNFGAFFLESTTPSTANQEFIVTHRLGIAPYLAFPVLALNSSESQLVPLRVSRPADATYLYLRSTSTGAVVRLFLEGGG